MRKQKGVAIVLVLFVVALATMLVINLTYSTFLSARTTGLVERSLQSEYLLKSILNFSQIMIQADITEDDSYQEDLWGFFAKNPRIPNHYFGITDQSSEVSLQVVPTNSKFNISELSRVRSNPNRDDPDPKAQAIERVMNDLDFDGELLEVDNKKIAGGRSYQVRDLIGNIIDWQDSNNQSFEDSFYTGSEEQVDKEVVRNKPFNLIGQLNEVPGMTPRRLQALLPYVTAVGEGQASFTGININTASSEVLLKAHQEFDEGTVSAIQQYLESSGPFRSTADINDAGFLPTGVAASQVFTTRSSSFDIYAEVKSGLQRPYYLKARLARGVGKGALPQVLYAIYY